VRDPHGGPLSLWQPGTHSGTDTSGRPGTLAGVQLRTHDPDGAHAFLSAVMGWQLRSVGTITLDENTVATWTQARTTSRPADPSPWLIRFLVADVSATLERAQQLGARPVDDEPGVLIDPAGALFGIRPIAHEAAQLFGRPPVRWW
jgi:predicted enzyme related to lactoylglutathione lyase